MKPYILLEKAVGETPLQCAEDYRAKHPELKGVPMAYAGRLDPMASGKLLVLLGDECKVQEKYHSLDKEYEFEVLFGVKSDTADVLGLVEGCAVPDFDEVKIRRIAKDLTGEIELPYPHYSSKTVQGKPLHTWALEGRLSEIEIPTKKSKIHTLKLSSLKTYTLQEVYDYATTKIETIPTVTDERKLLGKDFRRNDVRATWKELLVSKPAEKYTVAKFTCIASSGTYMRTLAEIIAKEVDTCALAYSIHRTKIGLYRDLPFGFGYWKKTF